MEICNHLNYMRSLSPGKAVFFYRTQENDFNPLRVDKTSINGQKAGLSDGYDNRFSPLNLEPHALTYSNLHTIDSCYVPPGVNEVSCRFSLRAEANSLEPHICSEDKIRKILCNLAACYRDKGGYTELARRYSKNILMGSWLWRNRHTRGTTINIETSSGCKVDITDSRMLSWNEIWKKEDQTQLLNLTEELAEALSNPRIYWFADITAHLKVGFCDEIFPSQKFVDNVAKGEPSRQLATVNLDDGRESACFTAIKVGAAIHQIDDWWSSDADKPLRVHEYGADRTNMVAMRHPLTQKDFYHLLTRVEVLMHQLRVCKSGDGSDIPSDIHFVMSVLIKGGMFQRGKEK